MKLKFSISISLEHTPKDDEYRESDIAGTSTERLPEFEEADVRTGFQPKAR